MRGNDKQMRNQTHTLFNLYHIAMLWLVVAIICGQPARRYDGELSPPYCSPIALISMVFDFLYFSILIYDGRDAHASISEFARTLRHAGDNAMCASYNAFYKANFVVQRRSLVLLVASLIETNRDALIEVLYFTSFSIFQIFQERERDHFVSSIRAFSSHLLTVCSPSSVHLL